MTQRAFLVGTIGLCFYFISVTNGLPPSFSVLTWLAISLLIASGAVALLSLQGLKCRFRITRASGTAEWPASTRGAILEEAATESAENQRVPQLEVHLENGGTLNKTGLVLTVRLRAQSSSQEIVRRFVVEALPSTKSLTALLPLDNLPRGSYQIAGINLTGSDVLGLFRVTARYQAARHGEGALRIAIAPSHLDARGASARGGEEGARRGARGGDDELRGTRPFVAGDDLRSVHWKTTARLGHLVVREFDATSRRRAFVLWDGGASTRRISPKRASSHDEASKVRVENQAVEQSLRCAMSLCAALSQGNRDCVLLRLDANPQRVAAGAAAFLARCGESLAMAAPNRATPFSQPSAALVSRSGVRGDAFFVVTHRADETLLSSCRAWRAQNAEVSVALVESDAPPRASTRARAERNAPQNPKSAKVSVSANSRVASTGAALSGETMRDFASELRATGARVAIVEARGEARESVENAMRVLLESAAGARQNGSAAENGDAVSRAEFAKSQNAAGFSPPRDSVFRDAETSEENARREVIS